MSGVTARILTSMLDTVAAHHSDPMAELLQKAVDKLVLALAADVTTEPAVRTALIAMDTYRAITDRPLLHAGFKAKASYAKAREAREWLNQYADRNEALAKEFVRRRTMLLIKNPGCKINAKTLAGEIGSEGGDEAKPFKSGYTLEKRLSPSAAFDAVKAGLAIIAPEVLATIVRPRQSRTESRS